MSKKVDETVEVVEELNTPEGNKVEVVEKQGFVKKAWGWTKRNGKKIAIGAAGVGLAIGGYALGSHKKNQNEVPGLDVIDLDGEDVEMFDADIADEISNEN